MHSYYSNREQNVINADYTIMVAEVASTVNEILLSDYQIKNEKDNKKKAELLYELLEMIRATLFRQAMFAEFEKDVHDKIENNVMLSADDLNDMYYKLNQKYFGPDVNIDEQEFLIFIVIFMCINIVQVFLLLLPLHLKY